MKHMNKTSKCPICNQEVQDGYFPFPKLPKSSTFASVYGLTHIKCLLSHPQKTEIQKELTEIYLKIFGKDSYSPVIAKIGMILVKDRHDSNIFEVYDFEDFVEFYIPYLQAMQVTEMTANQELEIGTNKWLKLTAKSDESLNLSYFSQFHNHKHIDSVDLSALNLSILKELISEAMLESEKRGNFRSADFQIGHGSDVN
jgi:hypothetical protein